MLAFFFSDTSGLHISLSNQGIVSGLHIFSFLHLDRGENIQTSPKIIISIFS